MHTTKKEVDPYTIEAHITLAKEDLAPYVRTATERVTQEVTIEGFRKGKAPKDLVEKQLDPSVIRHEALELALEGSFSAAAETEQWDVMNTSDLKIIKNDSDSLEYSIRVALWPAVQLPELSSVKVPRKEVQASDQEIEQALDTVLNMRSTFLDKTGPAAMGDRVEADFDAMTGGQSIEGGQSRNHPLIIGGKNFMPGFEEELVGLAAGQTKKFTLTAPEDYYEAKLAGKQIDFSVTVHRVQTVLKPTADDAFAKSVGGFKDMDQLKAGLRTGIVNEKQTKERQRLQLAILDELIAHGTVPAPKALVADELDGMVHRFADDLQGRGIELGMYLARMGKTEDALRSDWTAEAERQVRIMLVLRTVARTQDINVPPEELDAAIKETIAELLQTGQVQQEQVDVDRVRSALAQRLLTEKTLRYLEESCSPR